MPITLATKIDAYNALSIGIKGGHFHAVTGYSVPSALRAAYWLAWDLQCFKDSSKDISKGHMISANAVIQDTHFRKERFLRLLNRMLFRAAKPEERYTVLQRFYGLNQGLIERFYAGQLKWYDKARILIGKPPVPVSKALYNFSEKAFIKRARKAKDMPKKDSK